MQAKIFKLSVFVTLSMIQLNIIGQTGSYLPQKMENAHISKINDNNFLIVSNSDCYNFRKLLHPENIGNVQDSSVAVIYEYEADKGKFKLVSNTNNCKLYSGISYNNNTMYIAGGYNSSMQATNDLMALDISTGQWKKLPSMKYKRAMFALECINNKLYALNGTENAGKYEVFDISTNKWSAIEPKKKTPTVEHLDTIAASEVIDASIYFISMNGKKLFEYHTAENMLSAKSMSTFTKTDFCFNANNKKVYVADGITSGKIDGRMYVYHSLTDKWEPAGYNPFARIREAMFFYNNSLYIIGGNDASHSPTDIITISKPMK